MLTAPVADTAEFESRIAIARVFFEQRRLDWSFWTCLDLLDKKTRSNLTALFRKQHMRLVAEPPGLIAERVANPDRPLPELAFAEVMCEATRTDFVEVSGSVFHLPDHIAQAIYFPPGAWKAGMRGYVGYQRGEPVAILACVEAAGCVGIYSVGTHPYHQRKGYAEALLRHALKEAEARTGVTRTILQSTEAGMRLYTRLGYKPVTKFAVYVAEHRWR